MYDERDGVSIICFCSKKRALLRLSWGVVLDGKKGNAAGAINRPPQPPTPPSSINREATPREQQFKPGDRVRHSIFGDGIILKSEMQEQTEFVEVQFNAKIGKKKLSMDFAKLEKI